MDKANYARVHSDEEIGEAARLADIIWHESYADLLDKSQIDYMVEKLQSAAAMVDQIENQGYEYYLVQQDGENAGYLALQPKDGKLLLSKVYLLKSWRGRGLAAQMLEFSERRAKATGCAILWLTVNRHNERAIAAYEKNGFRKVRTQVADIGEGYVMDDYIMERDLVHSA